MHHAIAENNEECIEILIEASSKIDEKDVNGYTPLKTAIDMAFKTAINMEHERVGDIPSNHPRCRNIDKLFEKGARIGNVDFGIDKKRKMNLLKKCIGGNHVE